MNIDNLGVETNSRLVAQQLHEFFAVLSAIYRAVRLVADQA